MSSRATRGPAARSPRGPGRPERRERRTRRDDDRVPFVARPFQGLTGETDWVALREFVPAATATVGLAAGLPPVEVRVASVLPLAHPAIRRVDGLVWLGLQTSGAGTAGDASREVADALQRAFTTPVGQPVEPVARLGAGPRLQDLLDPAVPFDVTVHRTLDFWIADAGDQSQEVLSSLERANQSLTPCERVLPELSAYWTIMGDRTYLRWVLADDEDTALDSFARLYAGGGAALTDSSRVLGSFRAGGLLVPVWEVPTGTTAEQLVGPLGALADRLGEAAATTDPLTSDQRRARAGLVSRQFTIH